MRIGVITFSQTKDNYGQILQCFAMQQYLKKLGHHPFLIQYQPPVSAKASFKISRLFKYLTNIGGYLKWYYYNKQLQKQKNAYESSTRSVDRKFSKFLSENIDLTPLFTKEELISNPPLADAYISGSDQIWKNDDIYYLSFAPKSAKRVAYAPSFGGEISFPSPVEEMIKRELKSFTFLGIREESGVQLCHRLGFKEAVKVIDPTLLLEQNDYDKIKTHTTEKNYIFVYLLGNPTDCSIEDIQGYAKSLGKKVIYVCSQGRYDTYEKTYATIGEWLGYLSSADLVISNSFHCIAFSLIYNKQFVALPLSKGYEKMNVRINDLLGKIGMLERIWDHNLAEICNKNIKFDKFQKYIEDERNKSKNYLMSSLF